MDEEKYFSNITSRQKKHCYVATKTKCTQSGARSCLGLYIVLRRVCETESKNVITKGKDVFKDCGSQKVEDLQLKTKLRFVCIGII